MAREPRERKTAAGCPGTLREAWRPPAPAWARPPTHGRMQSRPCRRQLDHNSDNEPTPWTSHCLHAERGRATVVAINVWEQQEHRGRLRESRIADHRSGRHPVVSVVDPHPENRRCASQNRLALTANLIARPQCCASKSLLSSRSTPSPCLHWRWPRVIHLVAAPAGLVVRALPAPRRTRMCAPKRRLNRFLSR